VRIERGELVDVGAGAERLAAARENHHAQRGIGRERAHGAGQSVEERRVESIDLLRAVEEDARHPTLTFELNHAFIL